MSFWESTSEKMAAPSPENATASRVPSIRHARVKPASKVTVRPALNSFPAFATFMIPPTWVPLRLTLSVNSTGYNW